MARTRIKICGITRVEDAAQAVAAGADAIGLVFYAKSPRAVTVAKARAIVASVPAFVTCVGLFVDAPAAEVEAVLAEVPLDLLQFHGDESPEYCSGFGRPWIKALRVRPGLDLLEAARVYGEGRGLLLDAYKPGIPGGTGEVFDWQLIPDSLPLPVVLAGGLDAANIATAIRAVRPFAVDVSGGVELSKGIKDPAKILAFTREVASV